MPIDVVTLKAVAEELNTVLQNGRVEKIYQPETDEVTLQIKAGGKGYLLVVSANPAHPRIHISSQKKENALNAPAFCMLLRKYLIGAQLKTAEIFNNDRIIRLTFEGKNDLKDSRKLYLIVELMGRYSNIILTGEDMVILDAVRRIHFDQSTTRYILPGLPYVFQPQTRITFGEREKLKTFFDENPECTAEDVLKNISGVGKETATEIAASERPYEELCDFIDVTDTEKYRPCLKVKDGKPLDYFVYPYTTVRGEWEYYDTLNAALDVYYTKFDGEDRKKASSKTVGTVLKRLITKNERRIADNLERLKEWEGAEEIRRKGEFVTSYCYLIRSGDKELVCTDYYENKEVSVPLDPTLNPSQNAQVYYKKYNKLKRAKDSATAQLAELYPKKEYLMTVAAAIENCSLKSEFDEILSELNTFGGFVRKQGNKQKVKPSAPTHLVIHGYDVYFGKNNQQNVQTTFGIGVGNDLWLHVKAHHGAHMIVKGGMPDEATVVRCAEIAAFYSDAKNAPKVEIDYTLKKFVRKIPSGLPGLVTYTDYKTVLVTPSDVKEEERS